LPELIHLAAEYLTAGLRFDPHRMSKYLTLIEPDEDFPEWGRRLAYGDPTDTDPAATGSWNGRYSALTDLPLATVGGGPKGRVTWRVQMFDGRGRLFVGVLCPDASVPWQDDPVDVRRYALQLFRYESVCARVIAPAGEGGGAGGADAWHDLGTRNVPVVTVTADLATETLHFSAMNEVGYEELLSQRCRTLRVAELSTMHVFVAVGWGGRGTLELL
jgi:hypothetical protein